MIFLYTDFSLNGPYVGQLKSAIYEVNSNANIIDLMHDAPACNIKYSALLLKQLVNYLPNSCVCCCVVDPGVGGKRSNIVVRFDNKYFVGPDNGLFEYILRSEGLLKTYEITWKPKSLSNTFHGRDIFAPTAARIENKNFDGLTETSLNNIQRNIWDNDLYEIIHIDNFGNLMTGIHSSSMSFSESLTLNGYKVEYVKTYELMPESTLCWYINSSDLVEIGLKADSAKSYTKSLIGCSVQKSPV